MYNVKLDENKYFTGSYAKIGKVQGGINLPSLPPDMSKATCYKWDEYVIEYPIKVPVIDEETGEEREETQIVKETHIGWIFDEEKYTKETEAKRVEEIRQKREQAFEMIDKYQLILYYNSLTEEEKVALKEYRQAWLDAPETGVIPDKLAWMI